MLKFGLSIRAQDAQDGTSICTFTAAVTKAAGGSVEKVASRPESCSAAAAPENSGTFSIIESAAGNEDATVDGVVVEREDECHVQWRSVMLKLNRR